MKAQASQLSDPKSRSCLYSVFVMCSLIMGAYFIGGAFISEEYKERLTWWQGSENVQNSKYATCQNHCRPAGSEALPQGIIEKTSDLEMRPLWNYTKKKDTEKPSLSLLAMAVGIKQKDVVNKIVKKFPSSDFVVMLFHYDGKVDEWGGLAWSNSAIHVSALNQAKWWFAKRFLHPDIVAEYNYLFLWDEDIGVENFDPRRYLKIIKGEGLQISQPALDTVKSEVHYPITARVKNSKVHRRMYKFRGSGRCDVRSTDPPCTGWVEMMAPVFSKAAWRCVWHMIQNDLIHAWGLDKLLGYCARGDRAKNVGVVDSEYIVHLGLPTLGVSEKNKIFNRHLMHVSVDLCRKKQVPPSSPVVDGRVEVRRQSFNEMQIFQKRWKDAITTDKCWIDPYRKLANQSVVH
ncbi:hypothetical protein ACFE04_023454 [Oxalis oulophora]